MPLTIRQAEEIARDILRDTAANSAGRISDANPMAVYRTIVEEGIAPEIGNEYLSGREILESSLINEAQGEDLDALIADWKYADAEDLIQRQLSSAATGWATFFGPEADAGTATSATSSTLQDLTKAWTTNAYVGKMVRIISGTGVGQERKVLSNTATTLTLDATAGWTNWTTIPTAGSKYEIISLAVTNLQVTLATRIYAQGVTLDERFRFKTTKTPAVIVSSTATGGSIAVPTLPTLIDAGEAWTINEHVGRMVTITGGSGTGQIGVVRTNTSNTLTIVPLFPFAQWATAPTGTTVYQILEATIPAGGAKVPIPVIALETGESHNIALYTLTEFEDVSGAGSVWNTDAETIPARFFTGKNREGDPGLRERWRRYLQGLTRGTRRAIEAFMLNFIDPDDGSVPVHSVAINQSVYPALVYVEDGSGTAPAPLLAKLQDRLDATGPWLGYHELWAAGYPHTATSSVASATVIVVTIAALRDGYSFGVVKADIESRIRAYFDSLGIGDDIVYFGFLTAAVAPGVLDLSVATLNGGTANIAVAANAKAIASNISVS